MNSVAFEIDQPPRICTGLRRQLIRATMNAEPIRRLARPHGEAGSSGESVNESWFGLSWSPMARCVGASLLRWPRKPSPCLLLSLLLRSSNCDATLNVSVVPCQFRRTKQLTSLLISKGSKTGHFFPSTRRSHQKLGRNQPKHRCHRDSSALYLQTLVAGTTCMVTKWKMTRRATTVHSAMPSWMRSTSPHMGRTLASASFRGWSKCASRTSIRK